MPYAETTRVPVGQSRTEIDKLLRKHKATRIVIMDEPGEALVMFMLSGRLIKMVVPMTTNTSDQRRRSLWRALGLVIKAKLEAVTSKITTVEEEFLAHVVMPDGQTVSRWVEPALRLAYDQGQMPINPLMLEGPRQ